MSLDFLLTFVEARGRAEPINLMLIDAKVNYYDERIPIQEWQTRKEEGKFGPVYGQPFHGLPTLEVQTLRGPFKLAGTYAILDYLDDAFDAHAGRDMLQKGKVNMIRDVTMSFLLDFHELLRSETWDNPLDKVAVHKSRIMPFLLDLSRHISMNGLRKVFGADPATPLTAAGACAFEALELIESFFPSTLGEWPILAILRQRIASRPQIQAYLESGKRFAKITMSPYETPERIAAYAALPLEVPPRPTPTAETFKVAADMEDPPFRRKKKGRQPPRPSTVAGDSHTNNATALKTSWTATEQSHPTDNQRFFSMVDTTNSNPTRRAPPVESAFSDSEHVRPRKKSLSLFFRRNSKHKSKGSEKDAKNNEGMDSHSTNPGLRATLSHGQGLGKNKSLRSVHSDVTLDIRAAPRSQQNVEPPLPSQATRTRRLHNNNNGLLLTDSDYSDYEDLPDEVKPRAL